MSLLKKLNIDFSNSSVNAEIKLESPLNIEETLSKGGLLSELAADMNLDETLKKSDAKKNQRCAYLLNSIIANRQWVFIIDRKTWISGAIAAGMPKISINSLTPIINQLILDGIIHVVQEHDHKKNLSTIYSVSDEILDQFGVDKAKVSVLINTVINRTQECSDNTPEFSKVSDIVAIIDKEKLTLSLREKLEDLEFNNLSSTYLADLPIQDRDFLLSLTREV